MSIYCVEKYSLRINIEQRLVYQIVGEWKRKNCKLRSKWKAGHGSVHAREVSHFTLRCFTFNVIFSGFDCNWGYSLFVVLHMLWVQQGNFQAGSELFFGPIARVWFRLGKWARDKREPWGYLVARRSWPKQSIVEWALAELIMLVGQCWYAEAFLLSFEYLLSRDAVDWSTSLCLQAIL